jgi:hypothetical protein
MLYFFKGYVIMLFLIISIPAAYGVSIDEGSSIAVKSNSLAQGNFVADVNGGTSTVIAFGEISNLDEYHYVTDATGKHAEVMAHVVNGDNARYSAIILPRECNETNPTVPKSNSISAQESLSSDAADEVYISASVSNPEGDTASVRSDLSGVTNLKYSNYAKATASSAEANQSASLDGNAITFYRGAQNAEGDEVMGALAVTDGRLTVIDNGHGVSFSNSVKSTKSSAVSSDAVTIIGCDAFYVGWGAANKEGDRIGSGAQVFNGYLAQYTATASSTKKGVSTTQSGDAGGQTIYASNYASDKWFDNEGGNAGGDRSLSTVLIHGDNAKYTNSASASKNKVLSSEQLVSNAAYICTNGEGRSANGDYTGAHIIANNGAGPGNGLSSVSLDGYSLAIDTRNTQTTISQSISYISAPNVEFGTHADNSKGDYLDSFGFGENNIIIRGYLGRSLSSSSAASASQTISSISGIPDPDTPCSINIGVDSRDNAGDHAYAGAFMQNFGSINGYSGTTSSQKSQVLASESFMDVSALSGSISVRISKNLFIATFKYLI